MKRALVTGITGQDGSYLAELLLAKGYEVHGVMRRGSTFSTQRIDHLYQDPHQPDARLFLHHGELADASSLAAAVTAARPDEIYHLAGQSHVRVSFELPEYTADVNGLGTLRLLEAARRAAPAARIYLAGSSEVFGAAPAPQREETPFAPLSPYAAAKALVCQLGRMYREAYGLHVTVGILFNHESERRGETFVTRKITRAVGRIAHGLARELFLGNLDARRDWGHAPEYVEAMWRMVQLDTPVDLVVGTGVSHTVRELAELAFAHAGLDHREHVRPDPRYHRPGEPPDLRADPARAAAAIGWAPQVDFAALVRRMVDHDLDLAARERAAGR
ncbi:MAG TPA: GDP-mannose 4,6-dehydratase [Kofleriaceae bacterium]|nr:GDP-mannose 4,6-dehydratase [Kofleriaceae bacterium]